MTATLSIPNDYGSNSSYRLDNTDQDMCSALTVICYDLVHPM